MTKDQIYQIMPRCPADQAEAIMKVMPEIGIDTVLRQAAFIAQIAHESSELTRLVENLNYGAAGLVATFHKYFPNIEEATPYARDAQRIANKVYANRMGNGDEASGDGWKYRGRGPIQITGKDNYQACGDELNLSLLDIPDILLDPENGIRSAGWFWNKNKLSELADKGDMTTITHRINGGSMGIVERMKYYMKALEVLKAAA